MSVFVYAENSNGTYKKSTLEAVSYAKAVAEKAGAEVIAIAINPTDGADKLYTYGVSKVVVIKNDALQTFNAKVYSEVIAEIADGNYIIFPHTADSASIGSMVSVKKGYSLITNAMEAPENISPFQVKRKSFSGKGYMVVKAEKEGVVITVSPNAFGLKENGVSGGEETREVSAPTNNIQVVSHEQSSGKLDLKEAEIVVSAGRGMKGPENWGMIEELAHVLGAATASSKPVADIGWRPHSEHVGQTGKAISPNLYIAVGISGAIQHLAGVNGSKTIVVINNDPEAPFFKSADYGVVGDAFQVIPELTEKIKALKG